jgi:hypothetical protein
MTNIKVQLIWIIHSLTLAATHYEIVVFHLFGSSDQTNNGSGISDPSCLQNPKVVHHEILEAVTSLYKYTNAEKLRGDHCVKISIDRRINFQPLNGKNK